MNVIVKKLCAVAALSMTAATPALADYSIMDDPALPSVVFIEFDQSTTARANSFATKGKGVGVVELSGNDQNVAVKAVDGQQTASSSSKKSSNSDQGGSSVSDMLKAPTPQEVEKAIIQNQVDKRILENSNLR